MRRDMTTVIKDNRGRRTTSERSRGGMPRERWWMITESRRNGELVRCATGVGAEERSRARSSTRLQEQRRASEARRGHHLVGICSRMHILRPRCRRECSTCCLCCLE